ncbi:urease accessory protein [Plantactinospora sp. BC1]|uniref:urease accessory protein UreD n=1 Tax=Plantactinospora sp. BC1 TaxID=2108470 RepID=UPI000D1670F3|nr:urease accessory protein UreD [Plantactinospora sp. BC1]AVT29566.1 urease accessory protein [Plantactinospora sp. BC1]
MRWLDGVPELAPYQDQPAQLPAAAPGKVGLLRLDFACRGRRTALVDLFRQAPLLVQRALYWDAAMPEMACVFLVSTSGGTVQGDRYRIDVALGARARVHLATQAAQKIQQMDANYAAQVQRISLADEAYLEYLPEPVIPYRHSRFHSYTEVTLPESATALYAEVLLPGRKHRDGELFQYDLFSATLRVNRPGGPDLFVEKFVVEPGRFGADRRGVFGEFHVLGTVVLLTSAERAGRVADRTPPVWDADVPLAAGASRLPNDAGLLYRVLGMETEPVRERIREFCAVARAETVGRATPAAFRWR